MRITLPKLNTANPKVADLLDKARRAPSLGESAHYQRLARQIGA